MTKKSKKSLPVIPAVIVVLMVVFLVLLVRGIQNDKQAESATSAGIAFLESLESKDPAAVDEVRRSIRKAKLDAQRDEMLRQVTSGEVDPFTMFQDFVILGDSRAVGFYYFDYLDESRVLAGGGDTIRNIEMNMDSILALNPSYVFLCYGLNDTSIGYWDTKEDYVAEYMQIIDDLQARLPHAAIIVSSILPARDPAFNMSSKWYNIPEWSAAVEQACQEKGIAFANNDQISEKYADLWDPDGIHVKEAFYPYWAINLIAASLQGGGTDEA